MTGPDLLIGEDGLETLEAHLLEPLLVADGRTAPLPVVIVHVVVVPAAPGAARQAVLPDDDVRTGHHERVGPLPTGENAPSSLKA